MSQPEPAPGASSLAGRATHRYEGASRWLNQRAALRALVAVPRTAPVLPLHGSRRLSRVGAEQFLGFDLVNTVHGLAQSVWDIRRVIGWTALRQSCR